MREPGQETAALRGVAWWWGVPHLPLLQNFCQGQDSIPERVGQELQVAGDTVSAPRGNVQSQGERMDPKQRRGVSAAPTDPEWRLWLPLTEKNSYLWVGRYLLNIWQMIQSLSSNISNVVSTC